MDNRERKNLSPEAVQVYDRMLARVEERLADAENRTWETLKREIDDAVEFEEGFQRLTREEASLLGAYLRRDLSHMVQFVNETGEGVREWLRLDLSLVEQRLLELLLSIADNTRVDSVELEQRITHGPGQYMSGEVATAGVLRCLECRHALCLTETTHLEPCHHCQSHYFERVTGRWPHEPEIEDVQ
jgi:hypothetical protein